MMMMMSIEKKYTNVSQKIKYIHIVLCKRSKKSEKVLFEIDGW